MRIKIDIKAAIYQYIVKVNHSSLDNGRSGVLQTVSYPVCPHEDTTDRGYLYIFIFISEPLRQITSNIWVIVVFLLRLQVWSPHFPHRAALQFPAVPLRRGCSQGHIFEKHLQLLCECLVSGIWRNKSNMFLTDV